MLLCDMYLTFSNGKYIERWGGGGGGGIFLCRLILFVSIHFAFLPWFGVPHSEETSSQINDG